MHINKVFCLVHTCLSRDFFLKKEFNKKKCKKEGIISQELCERFAPSCCRSDEEVAIAYNVYGDFKYL